MKSKIALASLLVGVFSFVQLLGMEKGVLAIVFGLWALKEPGAAEKERKIAWTGISLGIAYLLVITFTTAFYFPKIGAILEKIK